MNERTTVRLPAELLKRAKRKAAADGSTLTAMIEEGLRRVIGESDAKRPRIPIPISTRSGGLMPGVDLSDSAALQEMEDLERFPSKP